YEAGDAEYLYNMVRHFKPKRIIEIGSGFSTLMVRNAIAKNKDGDANYHCDHICIEPYEVPWLEKTATMIAPKAISVVPTILRYLIIVIFKYKNAHSVD
ncbi:MAG: hypothetical protein ACXVA2_23020, partial [Mucilaginibacter sp.]